jgi:hypothetical protein
LRGGARALAVFTVAVVTVLALAIPADASTARKFAGSAESVYALCVAVGGNGEIHSVAGATWSTCTLSDGTVISCFGDDCVAITPRKKVESLANGYPGGRGA